MPSQRLETFGYTCDVVETYVTLLFSILQHNWQFIPATSQVCEISAFPGKSGFQAQFNFFLLSGDSCLEVTFQFFAVVCKWDCHFNIFPNMSTSSEQFPKIKTDQHTMMLIPIPNGKVAPSGNRFAPWSSMMTGPGSVPHPMHGCEWSAIRSSGRLDGWEQP